MVRTHHLCYLLMLLLSDWEGGSMICTSSCRYLFTAVLYGFPAVVCPSSALNIDEGQTTAGNPHRTAANRYLHELAHITEPPLPARHLTITLIDSIDDEISPSWHNRINPIMHYHHSFGWKPDDGRNRPKHVIIIIHY